MNNGKRRGGGPNGPTIQIPTGFAQSQLFKTGGGTRLSPPLNGVLKIGRRGEIKSKTDV